MSSFVGFAVNPKPDGDTTLGSSDRQWAMLHSSGLMMVSHGLHVPTDTPGQSVGSRSLGLKGSWSLPRWGWGSASYPGYQMDAGRAIIVTDWTPDKLAGYVFDTYGAIWPFGPDTPYAATGPAGAPFGDLPPSGTPIYKHFQMHSANSQAFGLGGFPSGFGWILSFDGVFYPGWPPGAAPSLQDPYLDILGTPGMTPINNSGVPGTNPTVDSACIADFKVNPDNSGEYYVLFWSGRVLTGHAFGAAPTHAVSSAQPVGTSGNAYLLPHIDATTGNPDPFVAMHVNWGDSIIAITALGGLWGYNLGGSGTFPPFPAPPPWQGAASGGWQDIAIIPYRAPSHLYLMGGAGALWSSSISGNVTISGLATNGTHQTSTQPTLSWTYTADYAVPQKAYQVRVYKQSYITAQGGAFVAGQVAGTEEGWINDRNTATASDRINRNLVNGVAYRAYVRVQSAALAWSPWVNLPFTMAVPAPATPSSCTTTKHQGTFSPFVVGTIDITAGGSLGTGELRQFQVSAGGGAFVDVWGAEATAALPVTDQWPQTNVSLVYRVRAIKRVPGVVASAWRTAAPVMLDPVAGSPGGWRFIDVGPGAAGPVSILEIEVESESFKGQKLEGQFQGITQPYKTVTTAGRKGDDHTVTIHAWDPTTYRALYDMLSLSRPILYMNIFGRHWWVSASAGDWKQLLLGPQTGIDTTAIRDANDVTVELVQVNPPR